MDFSLRNKKVAIARWSKILAKEKQEIKNTPQILILKAAICGFLAGDGSVQLRKEKTINHYQIDFFPDDVLMKDIYLKAIYSVYGKCPFTRQQGKFYSVRITSRTIFEDLNQIAAFGIKTWRPAHALFSLNGAKEAWLRAFFSAEAYVGPSSIKIQTVNKAGMLEISKLLNELSIDHRCYTYNPAKTNYSPVSIIFINRKNARRVYLEKVGFWHTKKTAALRKTLDL